MLQLCLTCLFAQTIRYVSTKGTNPDPTTAISWATSTTNLQGAINSLSATGGEVWVATGTYKPTTSTDRTISFSMKNGVVIYGGFPDSGNPDMAQRSPATYTTTLSGEIGNLNLATDNSLHVIENQNVDNTAILDGFVITGGYAARAALAINQGGGMRNLASHPRLINCRFINNYAINGGAMSNIYDSGPTLLNCSMINNGSEQLGGGMFNSGSGHVVMINCNFIRNYCSQGGTSFLFCISSSTNDLINCIVWGNYGSPSAISGYIITATNCILSPETVLSRGANNLTTDPLFVDAAQGNYQLQNGSPAINAGNNSVYSTASGPVTDLAENPRIQYNQIDIGAYESAYSYDLTPILYARPSTIFGNSPFTIVVDVQNLMPVITSGTVVVKITKDAKIKLNFDPTATLIAGRSVQNSLWQLKDDPFYYVLTSNAQLAAEGRRSFGLIGSITPGETSGSLSVSSTIEAESGGELRLDNNIDSDKIDYFQQ